MKERAYNPKFYNVIPDWTQDDLMFGACTARPHEIRDGASIIFDPTIFPDSFEPGDQLSGGSRNHKTRR